LAAPDRGVDVRDRVMTIAVLAWSPVPVWRARGRADRDPSMAVKRRATARDEPDRWTPIDYVAACCRVVDVLINWYLRLDTPWRKHRPPLRERVRRAWRGPGTQ